MMILFTAIALLVVLTAGQSCNTGTIVGSLSVNDGMGPTYIAQTGGTKVGGISIQGGALRIQHDRRLYFAGTCAQSFGPDIFKLYKFLDATFSFTADLSQVGCGCNAALYLVQMPAYGANNQPDPTKCGDYYCDANNVCGVFCPEMDIFEANNRALQVTPHKCSAPQGKHYPSCDGGGCGINTYRTNQNGFGPGSQFTINTQQPFRVSISFKTASGALNSIHTVLSQNGKNFEFDHNDGRCGGGYLSSMTDAFQSGMVVVMSYWGTTAQTMSWLDIPPCGNEDCNTGTTVVFSDFQLSNSTYNTHLNY